MKVLVFGDQLVVGGSQVNAIELTAALRDFYGFEMLYFATPGPMVRLLEEKQLRYLPAPEAGIHPSPSRTKALRDIVRAERPDLIHVWDWWQCLDAFYGVHIPMRTPLLVTHMESDLTPILPKYLPTTYGTPKLCDDAKAEGRSRASALLPPVDIHLNSLDAVDPAPFRRQYGINDDDITVVTVSRLHPQLKSESLFRTVDALGKLGNEIPRLRYFIIGDGEIRQDLQREADRVNGLLGRSAVQLTGALLDPRPAYAAANIVVGMGGSALRGMAFGKPVIIVGEQGFSAPFIPESAEWFHYNGIFGRGESNPFSAGLPNDIRKFAKNPAALPEIGRFSRQFVVERYSLEAAAKQLAEAYQATLDDRAPIGAALFDAFRSAAVGAMEGKLIPYWTLRKLYHDYGGPSVFPRIRKIAGHLSISRK